LSDSTPAREAGTLGPRAVGDALGGPGTCGLILEGVSGSGKTTILQALLRSGRYLERGHLSSLVLTEHHTQRVLEPKQRREGLSVKDNVGLLRRHVETIGALEAHLRRTDWTARARTRHRVSYVLERFHLTHVCHYPHVAWGTSRTSTVRSPGSAASSAC
jgi:ABC-type glutathione transport system ATPase component